MKKLLLKQLSLTFAILLTLASCCFGDGLLKLGDTTHPATLFATDASGAPLNGLTVGVRVLKNGTSAAGGGTVTQPDTSNQPGVYLYTPSAADVNTYGDLVINPTASGAIFNIVRVEVVAFDPFSSTAFIASVPAVTGSVGSVTTPIAIAGASQTALATATRQEMDANSTQLANIDADILSRLATTAYVAPANPTDYARNNIPPGWYTAPPSFPTNFGLLAINGSGAITTSNPASGGGSGLSDASVQADVIAGLVAQGYTVTRGAKLDNLDATISGVSARIFAYTLAGTTFGDHVLNNSAVTWGASSPTYSGTTGQTNPYTLGGTLYVTTTLTRNAQGQVTARGSTLANQ